MKKNYKSKVIYMFIGFVVLLILSYVLAIKKTLKLKNDCKNLNTMVTNARYAPDAIQKIQNKIHYYDQYVGNNIADGDIQEKILDKISYYSLKNDISFRELPGKHLYFGKDHIVETNKVIIIGDGFHDLIKLLYTLENENKIGFIPSAKFYTQRNLKTKQNELLLDIYIQSIAFD